MNTFVACGVSQVSREFLREVQRRVCKELSGIFGIQYMKVEEAAVEPATFSLT